MPIDFGIASRLGYVWRFDGGGGGGAVEGPPPIRLWSESPFGPRFFPPFIDLEAGENVMKGTIPWLSHRCGSASVAGKFELLR